MKKIIALVLALTMLGAACCAMAEEGQGAPMYATVGDALDAARAAAGEESPVVAGGESGTYYAVITQEKDGTFYRHVADYDEKMKELEDARDSLDYEAEDYFDKLEAAWDEIEAYERTLPIAYSEKFTAEPLARADLDVLAGKTLADLFEAGYETEMSSCDGEDTVVFTLRNGLYIYFFTVDADMDAYDKALQDATEGAFVVKGAEFAGVSSSAWDRHFHADGTVEAEAPTDFTLEMSPEAAAIMEALGEFIEAAKNGEEVDISKLFDVIEEQFPDKKEEIESSREMITQLVETYGVEGLSQMFVPAE